MKKLLFIPVFPIGMVSFTEDGAIENSCDTQLAYIKRATQLNIDVANGVYTGADAVKRLKRMVEEGEGLCAKYN
jgi:hypothetical protein